LLKLGCSTCHARSDFPPVSVAKPLERNDAQDATFHFLPANRKVTDMFRCKLARLELRQTLKQLSKRTGLSISLLSLIEVGRVNPRPDELNAMAKALGLPAARLLDHVDASSLPAGAELRDAHQQEA
jgi:hypothetical protein